MLRRNKDKNNTVSIVNPLPIIAETEIIPRYGKGSVRTEHTNVITFSNTVSFFHFFIFHLQYRGIIPCLFYYCTRNKHNIIYTQKEIKANANKIYPVFSKTLVLV